MGFAGRGEGVVSALTANATNLTASYSECCCYIFGAEFGCGLHTTVAEQETVVQPPKARTKLLTQYSTLHKQIRSRSKQRVEEAAASSVPAF